MGLINDPLSLIIAGLTAFMLVPVAQWVFRLTARFDGYSEVAEAGERGNAAVGVRNAFFILAVVLAFRGILRTPGRSLREDVAAFVLYAVVALVLVTISRYVNDKLILHRFDNTKEVVGEANVPVALVEAATFLATAFIAAGAAGSGDMEATLASLALWFVVGQALLVALALLYERLVPGMSAALDTHNYACACSLSGLLLAAGIALGNAVSGPAQGWPDDAVSTAAFLAGWLTFMVVATAICDRVLLPGRKLRAEIMERDNVPAGLLEGAMFVAFTQLYVMVAAT